MIVFTPIVALALTAQGAPSPAPPAPPAPPSPMRNVDAPGYVSRCTMGSGQGARRFTATLTVVQQGKKRRVTIASDAPDILPPGEYRSGGVFQGGFFMTLKRTNEIIGAGKSGGIVVTSGWSDQSGSGALTVRPRGASGSDPRASNGTCRISWSAA